MLDLPPDVVKYYKAMRKDPERFARDILGIAPWSKQVEIMRSVLENRKTTVRSCNAAGKTATAAMIMNWFLPTFPDSVVITTAPTWRQVEHILWSEARKQYNRAKIPLGGNFLTTSWTMGPGWYALGLSTKEPDRFQGHHAAHILGIVDEASGVDPMIFEGLLSCLTSDEARLLYIGNPMTPSGVFYDSFQDPTFNKIHISAYDTPNLKEGRIVYPALISQAWIEDLKARLGPDYELSPEYQVRVMGEFPTYAENTVIPVDWVLLAIDREVEDDRSTCAVGIDPARFGDDETVIAVRYGQRIEPLKIMRRQDTVAVAKFAKSVIDEVHPQVVAIDGTGGLGAAIADTLRSWGYDNIVDMAVNGKAARDDRFYNKRAELWWNLREQFRTHDISIPDDDVLKSQLSYPRYKFDSKGRYQIEPKSEMKSRGLASPDRAEAVMLASCAVGPFPSFVIPEYKRAEPYKPGTLGWILDNFVNKKKEETPWIC